MIVRILFIVLLAESEINQEDSVTEGFLFGGPLFYHKIPRLDIPIDVADLV